jgi:hypothetical protein
MHDLCNLSLEAITLGIERLEAPLPSYLKRALTQFLKQQEAGQSHRALQKAREALSKVQANNCGPALTSPFKPSLPPLNGRQFAEQVDKVKEKAERYLALSSYHLDPQGWQQDTFCDGLLFNSLYALAGGSTDVSQAMERDGSWHRHWSKSCYQNSKLPAEERPPGKTSGSTISRDMFAGLFLLILEQGRTDWLAQLLAYGKPRNLFDLPFIWIMGEGDITRVDLRPGNIQDLYEIQEVLQGIPSPMKDRIFDTWGTCRGYECHLQFLNMYLKYRLRGHLSNAAVQRLKIMAEQNPFNALYTGFYGKIANDPVYLNMAFASLLNDKWFPQDRLPSSQERCSEYLFQRESQENGQWTRSWRPCPEEARVFSGTDFLFAAKVILNDE